MVNNTHCKVYRKPENFKSLSGSCWSYGVELAGFLSCFEARRIPWKQWGRCDFPGFQVKRVFDEPLCREQSRLRLANFKCILESLARKKFMSNFKFISEDVARLDLRTTSKSLKKPG
jgi:hypothetical protein